MSSYRMQKNIFQLSGQAVVPAMVERSMAYESRKRSSFRLSPFQLSE
jgi:hypothetical protein